MKIFFIIISFTSTFLFSFILFNSWSFKTQNNLITKNDSTLTIKISVVGDLMCHSPQFEFAKVSEDSFNFFPVFREVKKYLDKSDFIIGNLETVCAGKEIGYSGYPFFNSPDEFIFSLKEAGFDLLFTSNNHSLDKGEKGLFRTIEQIKKNNLHYCGAFLSQQDRDSIRIINIKNISVAFLAYTYGVNGNKIPDGEKFIINLIDTITIKNDIEKIKQKEVDLIFVYFHFGDEYKREPNEYQKTLIQKAIDYGADIVVGSHPHVIQPSMFVKSNNPNIDSSFIAFSLGNFISNQRWRYSDAGVILNLIIEKKLISKKIKITNVNFIPAWVFKGKSDINNEFLILPLLNNSSDSSFKFLSYSDRIKIRQAFFDINNTMKKYDKRIHLYSNN